MNEDQKRNKDGKYIKRPVLLFNGTKKRLAAIFSSVTTAARILGATKTGIYHACAGKMISYYGHYFRYLYDDIEIDINDLDTLSISEYDQLCENPRRVYKARKTLRRDIINTVETN